MEQQENHKDLWGPSKGPWTVPVRGPSSVEAPLVLLFCSVLLQIPEQRAEVPVQERLDTCSSLLPHFTAPLQNLDPDPQLVRYLVF